MLMSRGIVGAFETWKVGIGYPCMTGDIASTAGLTVHEPDDGVVYFAKWRPFDQNAVSRSAVLAPAHEDDGPGRGADDTTASLQSDRDTSQSRWSEAPNAEAGAKFVLAWPADRFPLIINPAQESFGMVADCKPSGECCCRG
jgi:hypothetical protein